ncbi:uroporphyrinogen-III C-methyltransferase [Solimonas soli]|uniref:uroporphyrinogen-III C-methyltransferase n=1 Tax=Solimonas soli TaxID=413479 RepID=UPI000486386E|nr:uroporphyrinogen-III C-methyltransferase [Solimonas soli]
MTESEVSKPFPPGPAPDAPRHYVRWLLLLVAAALLAGGGAWLYARVSSLYAEQDELLRRTSRDLNALEVQADRLESRQADLNAAVQRSADDLAAFGKRIDANEQLVGDLKDQINGGRGHFQLAAVEQLLLLANDRLQLARDVPAALIAIDEADARLVALREPRLFPVRQALAQEKAALQAVPLPDYAGAALTLSSLIQRAPRLPLVARVPTRFEATPERVPLPEHARWYQRAWASVREALSSIFSVRRDSGPSPRLLGAEQEALVVQVLALKLEGARVALLRGDTTSFRDLCESAAAWLDTYFQHDDPGVAAARAELERLRPLDLSPPLPDIGRSLNLLRAFMRPAATP